MVDLPLELIVQAFNGAYKRGAVFRLDNYVLRPGETRDKFLVIANIDPTEETAYHLLCTSKVEKYVKLPWSGEGLLIPAGTFAFMPKETIVDCHVVYANLTRSVLLAAYAKSACKIVGQLDDDRIKVIEMLIGSSKAIPTQIKSRVLP